MPVDCCALNNRIRPKDHIDILRPFLPARHSPLQANGDGLQSVYLTEVPQALADALIGLIGQAYWDALASLTNLQAEAELENTDDAEVVIGDRGLTGPTFREQLVRARSGSLHRGYITFSNTQQLLIVPEVRDRLLDAWGIDSGVRVGNRRHLLD